MKVLAAPAGFSISDELGSDSLVCYKLIEALASEYDVTFYAITNSYTTARPLPSQVKVIEERVSINNEVLARVIFRIKCLRKALKILGNERIDLIHQIHGAPINPLALHKLSQNYPFIIGPIFYDPPHSYEQTGLLNKLVIKSISKPMNALMFKTLENSDTIIAATETTKRYYSRFVDGKKITVIPEGVDCREFFYTPPPQNYDILALGIHAKHEGFEYLIKAMRAVVRGYPQARLHLLGDGPERPNLERLVKKFDLSDKVIFYGFVPRKQVYEFYRRCRLVCSPALIKSSGLVSRESMASGRPIIATNTIGYREIIANGKTGFIVPIADSDALAEAIMKLLADYDLTCKMGAEGRKIAEEKYDWRVIAKQYYQVYKSIL